MDSTQGLDEVWALLREQQAQLQAEQTKRRELEAQMRELQKERQSRVTGRRGLLLRPLLYRSFILVSLLAWMLAPSFTEATGLPNTWQTRASLSAARYNLAAAAAPDGRIYAIGGYSGGYSAAVEAYDPTTNTWQSRASMPTARWELTAATGSDGKIYVFGGNNGSTLNTVEAYDPSTNTWQSRTPMPTARAYAAAVAASNGKIYVLGGTAGTSTFTIVEAYNPSTNTWTCSTGDASCTAAQQTLGNPMGTARSSLAAAAPNGKIYAIGGFDGTNRLQTVESYNPASPGSGWTPVASMSAARNSLTAVTGADGKIYAIGGFNGSVILSTVEAYTPSSNTWATVAPMPTARYLFAAAPGSDGKIYAIGGDSSTTLATVEAYSLGQESGLWGIGQVGVLGLQAGTILPATGVSAGLYGYGTYGGYFGGTTSQLHLIPGGNTGHPSTGKKGDIDMDSTGTIFVCIAGSPCTTWQQLATTP